jgi:hypothetical protein
MLINEKFQSVKESSGSDRRTVYIECDKCGTALTIPTEFIDKIDNCPICNSLLKKPRKLEMHLISFEELDSERKLYLGVSRNNNEIMGAGLFKKPEYDYELKYEDSELTKADVDESELHVTIDFNQNYYGDAYFDFTVTSNISCREETSQAFGLEKLPKLVETLNANSIPFTIRNFKEMRNEQYQKLKYINASFEAVKQFPDELKLLIEISDDPDIHNDKAEDLCADFDSGRSYDMPI